MRRLALTLALAALLGLVGLIALNRPAPAPSPHAAPAAYAALDAQLKRWPLPADRRAALARCASPQLSGLPDHDGALEALLLRCAHEGGPITDWGGLAAPLRRDFQATLRAQGLDEASASAIAACLGARISAEATRRACPLLSDAAWRLNPLEGCLSSEDPAFEAILKACHRP